MKQEPHVSVIMLSWNNEDDIINCLNSILENGYFNYSIILVDNNSAPASLGKIEKWISQSNISSVVLNNQNDDLTLPIFSQKKLVFVKNNRNLGFTGGNNVGWEIARQIEKTSFLLLLNGDTKVSPNFLAEMVDVLQKDEKIGSAQSLLLRFDKKTVDSLGIEMKGYRIYDAGGSKNINILEKIEAIQEIFGACGAAAFYRTDIIKKIGLFDEGLFATYEDFDLAWRIRLEGYKTVLVKKSVVFHRGGISRRKSNHVMFDLRSYFAARNILSMYARYYPFKIKVLLNSVIWFGVGVISAIKNGRLKDFSAMITRSPRERRMLARNQLLKKIQMDWIK